jgi:hypothetical protein
VLVLVGGEDGPDRRTGMKTLGLGAALLFLCGVLAAPLPAHAQQVRDCSQTVATDNRTLNPGYLSCAGPVPYTLAFMLDLVDLQSIYPVQWSRLGFSTDAGFGPFSSNLTGLNSGTLEFDTPRHDLFVVALQALDRYVFYRFDYSALTPTSSIRFDTLGIASSSPPLQVAALYIPLDATPVPVPPVPLPEPGTWMLTLVGLCMLATGRCRDAAS